MTKKTALFALILLSLPGAFLCFYATNLILSDVANMFYMSLTKDVISSIPLFLLAVEFVMVSVCILHVCLYPDARVRLLRRNACAAAVLSVIGAVCAVLCGTSIYGSFTAPYPFPGATILLLVVHIALAACAVMTVCKYRGAVRADETRPRRFGRGVQWVLLMIFIYYAFDRFGALLWSPVYVQASSLGRTFPFYLSLLLPVCLLLHHCRYRLGLYLNPRLSGVLYPAIYLAADILLCVAVVTGGMNDTQFIAAVSPALGIERLLGAPVITIVHFVLTTLPILGSLVHAVVKAARTRKNDKAPA